MIALLFAVGRGLTPVAPALARIAFSPLTIGAILVIVILFRLRARPHDS